MEKQAASGGSLIRVLYIGRFIILGIPLYLVIRHNGRLAVSAEALTVLGAPYTGRIVKQGKFFILECSVYREIAESGSSLYRMIQFSVSGVPVRSIVSGNLLFRGSLLCRSLEGVLRTAELLAKKVGCQVVLCR